MFPFSLIASKECLGEMSFAKRHLKYPPPIFFALGKENGPWTVQKKPLWPPNGGTPFAANTGVRKRERPKIFSRSVGRERKSGNSIGDQPREPELRERAKTELPCFSFRCRYPPVGREIQRGGAAVPPLCVGSRGCGGKSKSPHVSGGAWGGVFAPKTSPHTPAREWLNNGHIVYGSKRT